MRRTPFRVPCAVVAFTLAASAHGDSLSSYKKQVAEDPRSKRLERQSMRYKQEI